MAEQAVRLAYAHGSVFTTRAAGGVCRGGRPAPAHRRAGDLPGLRRIGGDRDGPQAGPRLPPGPRRTGPLDRLRAVGELSRQHARAPWTCPGRQPLRRPYEGWLGRFRHVSAAYPYRGGRPGRNALAHGDELAAELDAAIEAAGPGTVAAFVAEPIVGATLAAAVPPDDYWPRSPRSAAPRRPAHRRRGHDRLRPDRALVRPATTGASSPTCSWRPRGRRPATGRSGSWPRRTRSIGGHRRGRLHPRVHLFPPTGRGGRRARGPADPRDRGPGRRRARRRASGSGRCSRGARRPPGGRRDPRSGPAGRRGARGRPGDTRAVPRAARITEAVVRGARERGVLVYSGTGNADGTNGDMILLGPPFIVTDDELAPDRGGPGRGRGPAVGELPGPPHRRDARGDRASSTPAEAPAGGPRPGR